MPDLTSHRLETAVRAHAGSSRVTAVHAPVTASHRKSPRVTAIHRESPFVTIAIWEVLGANACFALSVCTLPHFSGPPNVRFPAGRARPKRTAMHRNAPPCTALHRSAPQCIAMHRNAPPCTGMHRNASVGRAGSALQTIVSPRYLRLFPRSAAKNRCALPLRRAAGRLAARLRWLATLSTVIYGALGALERTGAAPPDTALDSPTFRHRTKREHRD